MIDAVAPGPGDKVLISGATEGVGVLAIQLAKARGARAIATASPAKADFVRRFGADEVADYTKGLSAELRRLGAMRVQCAVDLAGDGLALAELVEEGAGSPSPWR